MTSAWVHFNIQSFYGIMASLFSVMTFFIAYLVTVIGARERVLRMDYKPLLLQRPWDSARLYVRKKREVTSAVSLESSIMNMTL